MTMDSVAVATLTWVRSDQEERVLRKALEALSRQRLPVAVADRGSSLEFTTFLRGLPGFTVIANVDGGLVAQVCAGMNAAARFGRPHILYTEPDKEDFFRTRLSTFLCSAPDASRNGVVIAARDASSFSTYPRLQQRAEGIINDLCAEVIGIAGDYSYGPFLMPAEMLHHVVALEAAIGWGWRHRVFLTAHREQRPVVHVAGDHPCPPDGQQEDAAERAHRLRQLSQNILGLIE
jgi:hypothetical protein